MKIDIGQPYSFMQLGQRSNQEDARYPDSDILGEGQRFFLVCDGVGGNEGGEIASNTVCRTFGKILSRTDFASSELTNDLFSSALDAAYTALDAVAGKKNKDMATTMAFVCLHSGGCTIAHIGDSRIYHIRPGFGILYRSDDHSLVNSMVHSGMITPEEAINHPQNNVITRNMGPTSEDENRCMATKINTTDISAGDYLFICTDGVLHCLTDEDIVDICNKSVDDHEKILEMAERCSVSSDNNTAMLIPITAVYGKSDETYCETQGKTTRILADETMTTKEIASIRKKYKQGKILRYLKKLLKLKMSS